MGEEWLPCQNVVHSIKRQVWMCRLEASKEVFYYKMDSAKPTHRLITRNSQFISLLTMPDTHAAMT